MFAYCLCISKEFLTKTRKKDKKGTMPVFTIDSDFQIICQKSETFKNWLSLSKSYNRAKVNQIEVPQLLGCQLLEKNINFQALQTMVENVNF